MMEERKNEVIDNLLNIHNNFEPVEDDMVFEPTMFWLISAYNSKYDNRELIGGSWVRKNIPKLKELP